MQTKEKEIFLRRILHLPPVSPSSKIPAPILHGNSLDANANTFLPAPSVAVLKNIPVTRQSSPRSSSTPAAQTPHPSKIIPPPSTPPIMKRQISPPSTPPTPRTSNSTRSRSHHDRPSRPTTPPPSFPCSPPSQPMPFSGPYIPLTPPDHHHPFYSPTGYQNMGGQYFRPSPKIPTNSPSPSTPSFPIFPHAPNKILQLLQVYNNLFYSLSSMLMSSIPAFSAPQNYSPYHPNGYSTNYF